MRMAGSTGSTAINKILYGVHADFYQKSIFGRQNNVYDRPNGSWNIKEHDLSSYVLRGTLFIDTSSINLLYYEHFLP